MRQNIRLILLMLCMLINSCKNPVLENSIYLSNEKYEIGIRPDLGGKVMVFRQKGDKNVLKSETNTKAVEFPEDPCKAAHIGFIPCNGQTVWLGPQSDWWLQQDLDPELKEQKAVWPPDPYLDLGHYEIISQSLSKIVMKSPFSFISGIQLTKEISLTDSLVFFKVIAENIGTKPVAWDLWLNFRMDGHDKVFVGCDSSNIRIDNISPEIINRVDFIYYRGFFSYLPDINQSVQIRKYSKAYIYPEKPYIAGFSKNKVVILRFEKHARESLHPEQNLIEIYNCQSPNINESITELEYHSPYKRLLPGEKMETWQTWEISDYNGGQSTDEQIDWIKTNIEK